MNNMYKNKNGLFDRPMLRTVKAWKYMGLLSALLFLFYFDGNAQNISPEKFTIKGIVKTLKDNEPITGASVRVKGSKKGTTTNEKSEFFITVSKGDILEISFIGYTPSTYLVKGDAPANILLKESSSNLNQVVVVGYGSLKRADLSSAQTTITSKDISKTVNTTLEQAIQGRSSDVVVTQNSGQPGGGISVNIRGVSSVNGTSEPLYVIDGVQIEGSAGGSYGLTSSTNPLAGLNPADIESMEILKGPSATAIYGSRGTNGVVIITTKRGKAGDPKITYDFLYTLQDLPTFLPTMKLKDYASFITEYRSVLGMEQTVPEWGDLSLLGDGTNWQKELFRRAPLHKHQISMSGGNDKTTYYMSGEYFSQEGVAVGSGFDRYSFRLNVDNQARKWLKISTSLSINQTSDKVVLSNNDLLNIAISQSPNVPLKNADGSWGGPVDPTFAMTNPVGMANLVDNNYERTNGIGGITAEINLLKGLVFRTSLNGNIEFGMQSSFIPTYQFGSLVNTMAVSSKTNSKNFGWNWNQLLQYNVKINKHDIGFMVSHEANESVNSSLSGSRSGFVNNTIPELSLGDSKTATNNSSKGQWAMESYFSRLNYTFADKYIIQAAIRADGSENFSPDKRWGFFPSASLAWRLGQESFLKNVEWLDELKLRVEAGLTGNQGWTQAYFSSLNAASTPWGTGYLTSNYSNPDFQWEQTKTYSIGFNFSALKNRIQLEGDYYIKKTNDLIMSLPLPGYMGTNLAGSISSPQVNLGGLENKGYGITLNTVNLDGAFKWRTNLNVSGFRNKLLNLYSESATLDRTNWLMPAFISRSIIGQPLWQFYGYVKEGLFTSVDEVKNSAIPVNNTVAPGSTWVGDIKYKDMNGDGVIDGRDQTIIGNPWPKLNLGFTNTFNYKDFELSAMIIGGFGNDVFNYVRFKGENPTASWVGSGLLEGARDYAKLGTADNGEVYLINKNASIPRLVASDVNGNGNRATQDYVEDGSYVRLKNVQLTYSLPAEYLSRIKYIKSARLGLGVQNLLTITKYKGYDPEIGAYVGKEADPGNALIGIDYGRYPSTRMYTFNIALDF